MSESGSGKKDPTWQYARLANQSDKNAVTCNFCGKITKGGIHRAKQHLIGGFKNVLVCKKCPEHVREELREYVRKKVEEKDRVNLLSSSRIDVDEIYGIDDEDEDDTGNETFGKRLGSSYQSSSKSVQSSFKKSKSKGPIDFYFTPKPEDIVNSRKGAKGKQTRIDDAYNKELREKACMEVARWMYDVGIPFNAVKYDSFPIMFEAIAQCASGTKPPSYHEVRVPLLKKEFDIVDRMMKDHKECWAQVGCSLMADGWKDKRERTLINFLVNCPKGTMFIESVDASSYAKTGEKMFELLEKFLLKIGVENVIQVITDSASINVVAGRLLEKKYKHLFWTPCAAHCIDLILEDIGKLSNVKRTLKRGITLSGYIYNRAGLLNMMRRFTGGKELLRPAKTRFATGFLTLSSIHREKASLRKLFTSEDWSYSKWAKEQQGKQAAQIVLMPSFWKNVVYCLKVVAPLVRVLRLVDGEKKPAMAYIYEAMDRAKEAIAKAFIGNEDKYKEVFDIIDQRWNVQLHRPLHAAGHILNPEFFYANPSMERNREIIDGFYASIERLVPSIDLQDTIGKEFAVYRNATGVFSRDMAVRQRTLRAPADWWAAFGADAPHLQDFAIKILSLTCSASGCERNWSIFEHIHSKKRNRLSHKRLNDLVFIKYNRALRRRFNIRDTIDPISLDDIDESNEWLIGRMDGDSDEDEDAVFEDDSLTWGNVARAAGVIEPRYYSRKSSTTKQTATTEVASSSRLQLVDEEEEAFDDEEEEEEEEDMDVDKSHEEEVYEDVFSDDEF